MNQKEWQQYKFFFFYPQPVSVHVKVHMEQHVIHYRVSVCVYRVWWASSVIAVLLDSGSPSVQVRYVRAII